MPDTASFPHRGMAELTAALDHIAAAPADDGRLEGIVIRPAHGERRMPESARLSGAEGVVGDH